ncbi:phage tail tape measure C-terminal domain-containing protein, partial [Escherichia coli]
IDGLRDLAKWLIKNQELVVTFGKAVAVTMAFRLLKSGISGVIGTANSMISTFATVSTTIQGTFDLATTAVKRFNRASRMGLSTIPALIFAIRNAFAGLTAFMAANPIGFFFTAAVTAVSTLIWHMSSLRKKVEDVVNKVREIPEAMTQADRAMLESELSKKDREISRLEKEVETGKTLHFSAYTGPYEVGVDVDDSKKKLEKARKEREEVAKALDGGIAETIKQSITKKYREDIDAVNQKGNALIASVAKEIERLTKSNEKIAARSDLSDHEKSKLRAENNAELGRLYAQADEQKLKGYKARYEKGLGELATYSEELKKAQESNDMQGQKEAQTKIDATTEALKIVKEGMENLEISLSVKAGDGLVSINGGKIGEFSSTPVDANSKTMTGFWKQQMDSKRYQRVNLDGTALYDLQGQPVVGPRQLKEQLRQKKIYGDVKLEQLSENDRIAVIKTLTKARELDAEAADKAANRTAKAAERAAKKEQAAQQKLAAGYQKALDKADQLMGQMGESSKATVSFDQSLRDTTKSLTDLANAVPNEFITQEMIDKAKKRLEDLKNATPEYREMFNRRNVEQMISTWAQEADSIISAGYTPSREEKVADFEDTYNRNLKALIELRDKASDPKVVALYTKKINQLIAVGNTALIKETGTATQKLALEYENLAEQIESTWTDLFSGLTDVLTDFVINGKMSFSSLSQSILKDITNMVVKSQITLPLMNMLGMGTTAAGSSQSGNLLTGVASAVANQGVRISNTVNGDKSVGEATKETSSSVTGLGQTTQQTTSAIGTATNAIGSWVSGLFDSTEAKDAETKAVKDSIFSMQNLSSVTGALSAAFAMLGANASGSGNKWLNFGATVASGLVSVWASGGFDGLMSGSSGSTSGFNNLTSSAADGTNGIPAIPKFANGGIFGKDGVIPLRAYQKGGIANSPQLALFGEGDMNEAYVPLPDGRTIPVTLSTDGMSGGGNVLSPVSIEINVHSDGSTTESGDTESIWNNAAQRMKAIALETIAQEKRPGGSLNPNTQRN